MQFNFSAFNCVFISMPVSTKESKLAENNGAKIQDGETFLAQNDELVKR